MAHPVTTPLRVVRRWVKSGDQVELVKVVLRFAGNGDLDVLLDLGKLGTVLVVVAVRVAALNADGFHCKLGFVDSNRQACSNGQDGWLPERDTSS